MIETTDNNTRDIPVWLTGIVLLACIGGGGWLIKSYVEDRPRATIEVAVDDGSANARAKSFRGALAGGGPGSWSAGGGGGGGGGGNYTRGPVKDPSIDGVQQWNNSTTRVKVGNTVMMVSSAPNGRFDLSLSYFKTVRTPEQDQLSAMFNAVRQDSSWREYLKITDEQLVLMRKVPSSLYGSSPLKLDPADRAKLSELWKTYRDAAKGSAEKTAAEKALLAAVDAVGQRSAEPTRAYETARTEAIKASLTPEQIKLYKDAGTDRAPKPVAATPAPQKVDAPAKAVEK
jgi:hypothetical protein